MATSFDENLGIIAVHTGEKSLPLRVARAIRTVTRGHPDDPRGMAVRGQMPTAHEPVMAALPGLLARIAEDLDAKQSSCSGAEIGRHPSRSGCHGNEPEVDRPELVVA